MVLGFTPLFGHNNLPEIDLRLASHVLTCIYERHADEVTFCMETLNVIEVNFVCMQLLVIFFSFFFPSMFMVDNFQSLWGELLQRSHLFLSNYWEE
jgi:hypothetical protein